MEKLEKMQIEPITHEQINKILEKTINKTWEKFLCDDILLAEIKYFINSEWLLRKWLKSQILTRFLSRRNEELDIENKTWVEEFDRFIKSIEDNRQYNEELSENLTLNLFRNKENLKKLNYIKENSDITDDIILIAKNLSVNNPYHNFWHEIWVAEIVIKLCKEGNIERKILNLLVLAALFHDSWYTMEHNIDLEELSCNLAKSYIPNDVFNKLNVKREDFNKLIIMTKVGNRNTNNDEYIKILQDADLWWLWEWPYYILYTCMWMVDEWIITLNNFIEDEKKFIKENLINWQIFLSNIWNRILENPIESLKIIEWWPKSVLEKAYKLRNKDFTFEEFKKEIDNEIIKK